MGRDLRSGGVVVERALTRIGRWVGVLTVLGPDLVVAHVLSRFIAVLDSVTHKKGKGRTLEICEVELCQNQVQDRVCDRDGTLTV